MIDQLRVRLACLLCEIAFRIVPAGHCHLCGHPNDTHGEGGCAAQGLDDYSVCGCAL